MKSIQSLIKQTYFYYAVALVSLGLLSIGIYSFHSLRSNSRRLDEVGFRTKIHLIQGYNNLSNNLLVASGLIMHPTAIPSQNLFNRIISSTIYFNDAQFAIWFNRNIGKGQEFFISYKSEDFYLGRMKVFGDKRFNAKYLEDFFIYKNITKDDDEFSLIQNRINARNKVPGKLLYTGYYYDRLTNQNIFSFTRNVVASDGKLIGQVGIDYSIAGTQIQFEMLAGKMGLLLVQERNNRTVLEVPEHGEYLTSRDVEQQVGTRNPILSSFEIRAIVDDSELYHRFVGGKLIVYKVFKPNNNFNIIIYQSAWNFYKTIISPFVTFSLFISSLLYMFLFYFNKNKDRIINPLNSILMKIKKDTLIVGSQKNFSGHYPETPLLELNEIVQCINTLFEVINENFKNYRTELQINQETQNELERLVKKRSEQLIEKEKLAALGFMSAGLAHELKNPLNHICNGAQIINHQLNKLISAGITLPDSAQRALEKLTESNQIILDNGVRVDNIIKTLLLQARSGKEGHAHLVDISSLIKTNLDFVLSNYRPRINNRFEINFNAPKEKVIFNANPVDLGRVFINIFDNSCQAVIPKINANSSFIASFTITIINHEQYISIEIRDNGTGIKNSDLSQVFTPFFTTKAPGEGTGLGMNFVYEIIKQYHGEINIESEFNEFTLIKIKLPYEGVK